MKVSVKVITRARQERVERQPDGTYKIWVRTVPEAGKANERVSELLAEHFKKPKSAITILTGATASRKRLEIL